MLRESGLYALANLINRSAGLVLLPVYTRWLSAADFGRYALIISLLEVLSTLCGAGLVQAMTRLYFDYPEHDRRRDRLVTTTLLMILAVVAVFGVISPLIASPLALLLTGDHGHGTEMAAALPGVPCSVLLDILVGYFTMLRRPLAVLMVASAKAVFLIALTLFFIFTLDLGVLGVFAAQSLAFATIAIAGSALLLWRLGLHCDAGMLRRLLHFGLPLVPSVLADTASSVAERWIVNHLLGAAALGSWALAQRIGYTIQAFVSTPFAQTFFVRRLEAFENGRPQAALNRVLSSFFIMLGMAVFSLSLFAPEIIRVLAPHGFDETARILPLSALCVALAGVTMHVEVGLLFSKRTGVVSIISVTSLCATLPAIWIGIGLFGLAGAPIAQAVMLLVRIAVAWHVNRAVGFAEIGTEWRAGFATLLLLFVIGYLASSFGMSNGLGWTLPARWQLTGWQIVLAKVIGLLGSACLLFRSSLVSKETKAMMLGQGAPRMRSRLTNPREDPHKP